MKHHLYASAFVLSLFIACMDKGGSTASTSSDSTSKAEVLQSGDQKFTIETISDQFKNPWGIAFLPDGRILVTERAGEIRIIKGGKLLDEKISGVPAVVAEGQGGLLDIKLHPDYNTNAWIYLTYSKPGPGGAATTVARTKLNGNAFTDFTELFSALPFTSTGHHFGSRIAFDGKGHMFISSGERGTMENAQNLGNHLGKIIRLHDDGKVPTDNPFVNTKGAKAEIWSYGHRNPQGLIYDVERNELYDVEHGPKGGDELNRVEKGKNYGWPKITYGIDYDGTSITDKTSLPGMEQPVTYWVPSIAPCGLMKITSDKYPGWKNNYLVGALSLTHIARVELDANGKYVKQERLLDKFARFRCVVQSPDGFIYAATESPGKLIRLVPVK